LVIVDGLAAKLVIGCGALALHATTVGAEGDAGVVAVVGPVGLDEHPTAATIATSKNRRAHTL